MKWVKPAGSGQWYLSAVSRCLAACLALFLVAIGAAQLDSNEVDRTIAQTYKLLKVNRTEAQVLGRVEAVYRSQLAELHRKRPSDYLVKRDTLNSKYTHDFLAKLTPDQKSIYRKYIRSLRQAYIKAHKDVDPDNIYIWGGADIL